MKSMKAKLYHMGPDVAAEALVSKKPLSFLGGLNTETGVIIDDTHDLYGQSVKGKVLVYPFGKGSTGDCMRLWRVCHNGEGPLAIINTTADPIHVEGALLAGISILSGFEEDPTNVIQTGDRLVIKDGTVIVEEKVL